MLAKLYGVNISTVRKQLKDIFDSKVFEKKSVSEIIAHCADDGKLYETRYYDIHNSTSLGCDNKTLSIIKAICYNVYIIQIYTKNWKG